ncbi:GNAT family N-acetyltransferase [Acidilobus sp. 7A]|jgi:ribosomal protein S18 acetylase RimI-like enzyme|uniref:GNAT family N-acetyltransferase n=1 Tax=Acidilobus sp. 7A TaxID=1577685 RepID=UPI001F364100|nr:GNAT family N-acetyltransferase [Acidilobus sp. 7A]
MCLFAETGVSVRRASKDDVKQLAELVYRFFSFNAEFDPSWAPANNLLELAQRHADGIVSDPRLVTLVAVEGLQVVGYLTASLEENEMLYMRRQMVIRELYVKPQQRRQGIATLLVNKLSDEARRQSASLVTVEFPAGNKIAEDLYAKMGFRPYLLRYVKEV